MKNLVIVESPAKAKTIEGYLGKEYVVKSSYGHIRDLPERDLGVDVKNKFKPQYEISDDKKDTIKTLKKLSDDCDIVWLATDDDREGEAISWHLKESLDLNDSKTRRIVFREITKKAIINAIENPRTIDTNLVNAQQARRVLDRLVGYELSPVLWKKIKTGLSAGRVQSVAVRLIVEREREIDGFATSFHYYIKAIFDLPTGKKLQAILPDKYKTESDARAFLERCKNAVFTVKGTDKKAVFRSPQPPFTTSTLQQEAARKLYFSVSQTMLVAQKLYESGKITYMRTDSVNLSDDAMNDAKNNIIEHFGTNYSKPRKFANKNQSAQEAHEAIRPVNFAAESIEADAQEKKLYDLIWKRAIASQMSNAELEKTTVNIGISTTPEILQASGEVIKFDGFMKVYLEDTDDENDEDGSSGVIPVLNVGQILSLDEMNATQKYAKPAPRYTEASLVKKLEEMGIGRPSTYAPTISTILKRDYVVKESREGKEREYNIITLKSNAISQKNKTEIAGAEKNKLFPTNLAMVVNDFLVSNFDTVIDYQFTANVEEQFDKIADGNLDWVSMIENFYQPFHETIETSEQISRKDINTNRLLGQTPDGLNVYVKLGKFGAYAQIGDNEGEIKTANLKKGQLLENINMDEAMELFKLPREVGSFEGQPMVANIGKFGPYIKHGDKYYSLAKTDDPMTVTAERSIDIIAEKRQSESNKIIKEFAENAEVKVLNGKYGPYIVYGKRNIKIPKDRKPAELTLQDCTALAEAQPESDAKPKKKFFKKR
ncbi:MAG: type I DNA topoisomerase [Cytophagales bacterium]|nr:type I DNA topoisomerase [Cytophagales bacterium]